MKARLIIVEGPDNCGKSTLAREMAKRIGCAYWRLTSGPGLCEHEAMALYQRNALDNAKVNIQNGMTVIMDRHWPSDVVYGTVLRGRPSVDARVMEQLCEELDTIYIHCYRNNAVREHAKAKDPDHPYEDEDYVKIISGYDKLFYDMSVRSDRVVIGYYLDNFINRPEQLDAFISGIAKKYL